MSVANNHFRKQPRNIFATLMLLTTPLSALHAAPETPGNLAAPPTTSEQKTLLVQMQDAFTNIAQTVEPTVVNIKSERLRSVDAEQDIGGGGAPAPGVVPKRGTPNPHPPTLPGLRRSEATGSGVIVRPDGYILTNDHVVEGANGGVVTVTLSDGREFTGKVYADYKSDLAVVKIDPGTVALPVAGFADSASTRPGQWAIAVGSPFDLQNTMTVGIISATGRHQTIGGGPSTPGRYYPDLVQTDAAINPGNSGGPLFNIDGKVVGINVAIESPVEGSAGVGFAIPSDIAQQVMNSLIQSKKVTRGYLGLAPDDLTPALQTQYSQKEGAFIRDVRLDGPAGKAGLQASDIVVSFAGKPVRSEVGLRELISTTAPGTAVALAYVRDGQPGRLLVTLGTAPTLPQEDTAVPAVTASNALKPGLNVRDLQPRDRQRLGLPATTTGVLVIGLVPNSPAETAFMMAGLSQSGAVLPDVIVQKLGMKKITSKSDLTKTLAGLTPGSPTTLVLLYSLSNQQHQIALTLRL